MEYFKPDQIKKSNLHLLAEINKLVERVAVVQNNLNLTRKVFIKCARSRSN